MRDAMVALTVTNMDLIDGCSADAAGAAPDEKRATTAAELTDAVRNRARLASMRSSVGGTRQKKGGGTERMSDSRCSLSLDLV